MNIREMHYDFKKKFNKIDSQKNRNLLVPEIDWTLNEAVNLFIKWIGQPRLKTQLGFEKNHATTEDLRTLVVTEEIVPNSNLVVVLPSNYKYFVRARVDMTKGSCANKKGVVVIQQHDDLFEESAFYLSSFEWREVNAAFNSGGLQFFSDGTFTINKVILTYIRNHVYMHNAQDFGTGTYLHPSGVTLTGSANCELPEHTHREIVDIAVMLAAGEIQTSDFQLKIGKLNLDQIV